MKALVDADILPYELGAVFDESVSEYAVIHAVDNKIEEIVSRSGADEHVCFLTESKSNFRIGRATIAPYKGHRPHEKPYYWEAIRDYIKSVYKPFMAIGWEADDLIGDVCRSDIENTIICSRDKDLDTVPGWHYRWQCGQLQPERKYYVNDQEAERYFYEQLLTGDASDNIKGCYGIGKKKAEKILESSSDYFESVKETYIKVFGEGEIYYEDFRKKRYWRTAEEIMAENADLLYIGTDRSYLKRFT